LVCDFFLAIVPNSWYNKRQEGGDSVDLDLVASQLQSASNADQGFEGRLTFRVERGTVVCSVGQEILNKDEYGFLRGMHFALTALGIPETWEE